MLGKLNLDEFAFAGSGTTGGYGPTRNPWNLERITGGPRQAHRRPWRMVFVSPLPAPMTVGRCGFRSTLRSGGLQDIFWPGKHAGYRPLGILAGQRRPITRTVEDAALMLEILAGFDPLDAITLDRPVPAYSRAPTGFDCAVTA